MPVISPDTFDPLNRYVSVRTPQGVPLVDADLNEADDIRSFELRAFLRWYVEDGVPEGSDAFRIVGTGAADDVTISAGLAGPAPAVGNLEVGLGFVGRCIVGGRIAAIEADTTLRGQPLHSSQPGATALAADWGVAQVPELPAVDATVLLYLDVWDRPVTAEEEPGLVHAGLGTESASRLRREWIVRWTQAAGIPTFGDPDHVAGHGYYLLARLARRAADPVIQGEDISDERDRRLLMLPASLVDDLLGTSAGRYRRGLDRPAISLREAVNALLRGEMPSSPDTPIAPGPGDDDMSLAMLFAGPDAIVAIWHSNRVANTDQVFATRWDRSDPAAAASNPPQQVTAGALRHRLPHALRLPGAGDYVVVYESDTRDVHFRRAPLVAGLAAAAETVVADDANAFERHPLAVRSDDQLVFLFHHAPVAAPPARWVYRRRQYPPDWSEGGAAWLDAATGVDLSPITPLPASATVGEVHAVADEGGGIYVAFSTDADDIAVLRLQPATAAIEDWGGLTLASPGANVDRRPFLLAGTGEVWAFWEAQADGIFHARFDVGANAWGVASVVPGTDSPGDSDGRPSAVIGADGAVWLAWASVRSGTRDIWLVRRNPDTGAWGAPRQVVAAAGNDDVPYTLMDEAGAIWLFWRSDRAGQFDLHVKRLITAI